MEHKSGFVGVVGHPNVGKSTLTNRLIGQKVAIISKRPQTTRNRLLAILTEPEYQIIFIDTPGILKKLKTKRDHFMEEECQAAFSAEVDVMLILISVEYLPDASELEEILAKAPKNSTNFLLINKIDLIDKDKLLRRMAKYQELAGIKEIIPISAMKGENIDKLLSEVLTALPEGPVYYPEDIITDAPERFVIQEIIREKIFRLLSQEVPYCIAVKTEEVKERKNGMFYISATIFVEQDSQRSEEHTSELQSHSFISYAVFCLKKKTKLHNSLITHIHTHTSTI